MKQIKSVMLLKDLPGIPAGTVGDKCTEEGYDDVYTFKHKQLISSKYHISFFNNHPDWFKVEYQHEERCTVRIDWSFRSTDECFGRAEIGLDDKSAKELFDYLIEKRKDWLSTRCKKCGGELKRELYEPTPNLISGRERCQSCGEVAG